MERFRFETSARVVDDLVRQNGDIFELSRPQKRRRRLQLNAVRKAVINTQCLNMQLGRPSVHAQRLGSLYEENMEGKLTMLQEQVGIILLVLQDVWSHTHVRVSLDPRAEQFQPEASNRNMQVGGAWPEHVFRYVGEWEPLRGQAPGHQSDREGARQDLIGIGEGDHAVARHDLLGVGERDRRVAGEDLVGVGKSDRAIARQDLVGGGIARQSLVGASEIDRAVAGQEPVAAGESDRAVSGHDVAEDVESDLAAKWSGLAVRYLGQTRHLKAMMRKMMDAMENMAA